jgi:hypothetical protein
VLNHLRLARVSMSMGSEPASGRRRWKGAGCLLISLVGIFGAIAGFVNVATRARDDMFAAEDRLQATILVCDLVGDALDRNAGAHWPTGWAELEQLPAREWSRFRWPDDAAEVRRFVEIDFDVALRDLPRRADNGYHAIRPAPANAQFDSWKWYYEEMLRKIKLTGTDPDRP